MEYFDVTTQEFKLDIELVYEPLKNNEDEYDGPYFTLRFLPDYRSFFYETHDINEKMTKA
jgi:hypothetical protein